MRTSSAGCRQVGGKQPRGFITYLTAISIVVFLSVLMIYAYRSALLSQQIQSDLTLKVDYTEKEDAVLRSLVSIVPNRAARAMGGSSDLEDTDMKWETIFNDAINRADVLDSISESDMIKDGEIVANTGDNAEIAASSVIRAPARDDEQTGSNLVLAGLNRVPREWTEGAPPALSAASESLEQADSQYLIISDNKQYGSLASGKVGASVIDYPNWNLIEYPKIQFGYVAPGENFVAKRNWWAFQMDLGAQDAAKTKIATNYRDFVLSLYEMPSQLAISAAAYTAIGQHEDGTAWANTSIDGSIYANRAKLESFKAIGQSGSSSAQGVSRLAARRGVEISGDASVGGASYTGDPLKQGTREKYELENDGAYYPVSVATESGRAAFFPINTGMDFFDRYRNKDNDTQTSSLDDLIPVDVKPVSETTGWRDYSSGARQCTMQLDVTKVLGQDPRLTTATTDQSPLEMVFRWTVGNGKPGDGGASQTISVTDADRTAGAAVTTPWAVITLPGGRPAVLIYVERLQAYLISKGVSAADVAKNNSLVVNVKWQLPYDDTLHISETGRIRQPNPKALADDLCVVVRETSDMSSFKKGFSLVTNMRLYIDDDFNKIAVTPPHPSIPTPYYPACSLFAPEIRWGATESPMAVDLEGQINTLHNYDAKVDKTSGATNTPVRILDFKGGGGAGDEVFAANRIKANLKQIRHPAALPPIVMKNWLVVVEERRNEFYTTP